MFLCGTHPEITTLFIQMNYMKLNASTEFMFLKILIHFLKIFILLIYFLFLAASGLICSTQDLRCGSWATL